MLFKEIDSKLRGCITKGIRDSFQRSQKYKDIRNKSRVETPKYKKDGSLSKKLDVSYICNDCKELVKKVHVDHIEPVIPIDRKLANLDLNEYALRVHNLPCQVLCETCHKLKSKLENKQRKK